jgi:Icc-related predicted phosphoesterase
MKRRIAKLRYRLWRLGGVDIVVTHAPPLGVGDADDPAHQGFQALLTLLDQYKPQYLLHGHVHLSYAHNIPQQITYGETTVCNAGQRFELEVPDREYPQNQRGQVIFRNREPKKREE